MEYVITWEIAPLSLSKQQTKKGTSCCLNGKTLGGKTPKC